MKEFNLDLAKAGHPVQTRSGKPARIICFDRIDNNYPIIALVKNDDIKEEMCNSYTKEGRRYTYRDDDPEDLFMISIKKEGWINIYNTKEVGFIYNSKEEAIKNVNRSLKLKTTIKIEWEE